MEALIARITTHYELLRGQAAKSGRARHVAVLAIGMISVCAICVLLPFMLATTNTLLVEDEWEKFHNRGMFDAGNAVCSKDGKTIIYSTPLLGRGDIVADSGGTFKHVVGGKDTVEIQPALSPDGTLLSFIRQDGRSSAVWISDSDGRHQRRLTYPSVARDYFPRFVLNGSRVRFLRWKATSGASSETELREIDLKTGEEVAIGVGVEDMSDDRRWVCKAKINLKSGRSEVSVESIDGATQSVIGHGYCPRFSQSGQELAYIGDSRDRALYIATIQSENSRRLCGISGLAAPPVFDNSSGDILVTWSNVEKSALWRIDSDNGRLLQETILPKYVVRKRNDIE